jgi:membrane-associated phospholipid phosphatase
VTALRSLAALLVLTRAASGQEPPPRRFDLRPVLLVAAGTAALLPLDASITKLARSSGLQRSDFLRGGARAFNTLGDPGAVIVAGGSYIVGRVAHSEHLADLGFHAVEALVVSGAATGLVKGITGRQRPYVDDRDADDFTLGRGFSSGARTSFPSGHTTAAFAVASVVAAETRHWWPGASHVVVPLLYGGAGLVGLARVYDARHWTSDVVLGAAIGIASGRWVVRRGHAPRTRTPWPTTDRIELAPSTPGPGAGLSIRF